jgi:hypothetical protein
MVLSLKLLTIIKNRIITKKAIQYFAVCRNLFKNLLKYIDCDTSLNQSFDCRSCSNASAVIEKAIKVKENVIPIP